MIALRLLVAAGILGGFGWLCWRTLRAGALTRRGRASAPDLSAEQAEVAAQLRALLRPDRPEEPDP